MPLPRFARLPHEAQTAFLAVARFHFARDGRDGASLNRIIADAGLSKTSAYNYFDGKDDLFAAVAADSLSRAAGCLGDWAAAADEATLWSAFHAANDRLGRFLRDNPDDRVLLAMVGAGDGPPAWLQAFFANAVDLGLVDVLPGRDLMEQTTLAVLRAFDDWTLTQPLAGAEGASGVEELLRRLWARRTGESPCGA
ncbi:TetR/AcrR family transcriptional regulator [Caulobacter mirabilis]|uniref:TetR family transcriptional regulator n=1 Tax=Caulobacter mirabilis TaxID=69666 RepID=A0A2D2B030_9CAUL|nr:TetR/AcrR family transcriptional regulator [Caulobacter mirabilis]ATQ43537.1 TetR family transcriptional regulator [Caulobacter mirabilis]